MLNQLISLDRVFYALSDPSRRAIVEHLSKKAASVTELAEPFSMSMAAVVQHVQILEECGLIRTQKVGRVRTCRLETMPFEKMENWLVERKKFWNRNLDRLGEFLASQDLKKGKK